MSVPLGGRNLPNRLGMTGLSPIRLSPSSVLDQIKSFQDAAGKVSFRWHRSFAFWTAVGRLRVHSGQPEAKLRSLIPTIGRKHPIAWCRTGPLSDRGAGHHRVSDVCEIAVVHAVPCGSSPNPKNSMCFPADKVADLQMGQLSSRNQLSALTSSSWDARQSEYQHRREGG